MSSGELILILIVALIVFGPTKLPMLATHLGILFRKINQFKDQLSTLWQEQVNQIQLHENKRKAEEGDKKYSIKDNDQV
ncbi:twin-arginine translocase TatA/TatE family subunit [Legionella waltersii]|uniref:TatB protein (Twin arginine translocation) n=1 Tax=Legionella waltersii TaxID=66969 RepID=A0A0W1A4X7_9GAMM|nr:twin-arginine translocase TatA/TatE family subunit [Legionella waltersii]KTD76413.1 TatB protein (twin arginine translocation) [Legionella waltersii]SNV14320.1 sec-independent protein translocase protein TatB [Legionella waltersii]